MRKESSTEKKTSMSLIKKIESGLLTYDTDKHKYVSSVDKSNTLNNNYRRKEIRTKKKEGK